MTSVKLPGDANTDKRNVNLESVAMFLERDRKLEGQKVHIGNGLRQNQIQTFLLQG